MDVYIYFVKVLVLLACYNAIRYDLPDEIFQGAQEGYP